MDGTDLFAPESDRHQVLWQLKHRRELLEAEAAQAADRVQLDQEQLDRAETQFGRLAARLAETTAAIKRIEEEIADQAEEPPTHDDWRPGERLELAAIAALIAAGGIAGLAVIYATAKAILGRISDGLMP